MRAISLVFTLACVPVFAQQVAPQPDPRSVPQPSWTAQLPAHSKAMQDLQRRLFPKLNGQPLVTRPGPLLARIRSDGACSIPLLKAAPAGTPVPMPKLTPPQGPIDRLTPNTVPAPACPAFQGHVGAPAPALPPPSGPPPGTPAPHKQ